MLKSFDDLVSALDRAQIPHTADPSSQTVEVPAGAAGPGLVLLIRWLPRQELIQLMMPFPVVVPAARVPAALDAINRINHALVMPGLCMDPRRNLVFYRLVVPRRLPEGGVTEAELRAAMQTAVKTAKDFVETLREVAEEGLAAEAALDRASALRGH